MSIGVGVGDIIKLGEIAWTVLEGWKDAPRKYADICNSLRILTIIIEEFDRKTDRQETILDPRQLEPLLHNLREDIDELHSIVARAGVFDSTAYCKWNRIAFGMKSLRPTQKKFASDVRMLHFYLSTRSASSLARIESSQGRIENHFDDLAVIKASVAALQANNNRSEGLGRRSSVMTTRGGDDKRTWLELRRTLIDDGIDSSVIQNHKAQLFQYFRELREQDTLQENDDDELEDIEDVEEHLSSPADSELGDEGWDCSTYRTGSYAENNEHGGSLPEVEVNSVENDDSQDDHSKSDLECIAPSLFDTAPRRERSRYSAECDPEYYHRGPSLDKHNLEANDTYQASFLNDNKPQHDHDYAAKYHAKHSPHPGSTYEDSDSDVEVDPRDNRGHIENLDYDDEECTDTAMAPPLNNVSKSSLLRGRLKVPWGRKQ